MDELDPDRFSNIEKIGIILVLLAILCVWGYALFNPSTLTVILAILAVVFLYEFSHWLLFGITFTNQYFRKPGPPG